MMRERIRDYGKRRDNVAMQEYLGVCAQREKEREEAFGVAISDSIRSMGTRHGHPVLHNHAYYSRTMMVVLLIMRPRLSPFEHNEKQGWHTCTTFGGSIAIAIYPFSTILGTQRQSSSNVLEQKISLMKEHFLGGIY